MNIKEFKNIKHVYLESETKTLNIIDDFESKKYDLMIIHGTHQFFYNNEIFNVDFVLSKNKYLFRKPEKVDFYSNKSISLTQLKRGDCYFILKEMDKWISKNIDLKHLVPGEIYDIMYPHFLYLKAQSSYQYRKYFGSNSYTSEYVLSVMFSKQN